MARHDHVAALAATILEFRRMRAKHLPDELLSEAPFELLLRLFVADAAGQRLTGRDVAKHLRISGLAMSRWLKHLTNVGYIIGDGTGNLDDELTLSGLGFDAIESLLKEGVEMAEQEFKGTI